MDGNLVSGSRGVIGQLAGISDPPLAQAFPTPAFRKEGEGRGTHCAADASKIKSLGHPAGNRVRIVNSGRLHDAS